MKTLPLRACLVHPRDDEVGLGGLEQLGDRVGEALRVVVGDGLTGRVERDVDLQPLGARGLRKRLQAEVLEHPLQPQPDAAALDDRRRRPRIEVEDHHRGRGQRLGAVHLGVQLQGGEVGEPDERRQVVADAELDDLLRQRHRRDRDPVGPVRRALLLEEALVLDAVGEAHAGERAALEVGEQHRRDRRVVLDDVALREAGLGIEDLVEVRDLQGPPADLDLDAVADGRSGVEERRRRRLLAQTLVGRVAHHPVRRPFGELDLGDTRGLYPDRAARAAWGRRRRVGRRAARAPWRGGRARTR